MNRTYKKFRSKNRFNDPIENYAKLTDNLLTAAYKSKFINFRFYEDPKQCQVYLLSFVNCLKLFYHNLRKLTC